MQPQDQQAGKRGRAFARRSLGLRRLRVRRKCPERRTAVPAKRRATSKTLTGSMRWVSWHTRVARARARGERAHLAVWVLREAGIEDGIGHLHRAQPTVRTIPNYRDQPGSVYVAPGAQMARTRTRACTFRLERSRDRRRPHAGGVCAAQPHAKYGAHPYLIAQLVRVALVDGLGREEECVGHCENSDGAQASTATRVADARARGNLAACTSCSCTPSRSRPCSGRRAAIWRKCALRMSGRAFGSPSRHLYRRGSLRRQAVSLTSEGAACTGRLAARPACVVTASRQRALLTAAQHSSARWME